MKHYFLDYYAGNILSRKRKAPVWCLSVYPVMQKKTHAQKAGSLYRGYIAVDKTQRRSQHTLRPFSPRADTVVYLR